MKEIGNNHWVAPNIGATNESGFSALPGGYRPHDNGIFEDIGAFGYWWSATEYNSNSAWDRNIYHASANIYPYYDDGKAYGFSVRCLRNSPANLNNEVKNNQDIQLYPNPAIDRVYIDYTETKKVTMQVYNIIGECVLQSELMGGRNEIDAGKLSKGVYVIQIIGKNWKAQRKLTKE